MNFLEYIANGAISTIFRFLPQCRPSQPELGQVKIVAHRGVHENSVAIENTLPSFKIALDIRIWGIEFDIRFTKDLVPVVHHDPHCGRLFGRPDILIAKVNFQDLRKQVPQIPTLKEVVALCGKKLHLMVEIKDDLRGKTDYEDALAAELAGLDPNSDYHLLTLHPEFLAQVSFCSQRSVLDVIWLSPKEILSKNEAYGHGAIAGHFLFLSDEHIARLHTQDKKVGVGFLDSRNSLYREMARGADYIFTNHPLRLVSYLREK